MFYEEFEQTREPEDNDEETEKEETLGKRKSREKKRKEKPSKKLKKESFKQKKPGFDQVKQETQTKQASLKELVAKLHLLPEKQQQFYLEQISALNLRYAQLQADIELLSKQIQTGTYKVPAEAETQTEGEAPAPEMEAMPPAEAIEAQEEELVQSDDHAAEPIMEPETEAVSAAEALEEEAEEEPATAAPVKSTESEEIEEAATTQPDILFAESEVTKPVLQVMEPEAPAATAETPETISAPKATEEAQAQERVITEEYGVLPEESPTQEAAGTAPTFKITEEFEVLKHEGREKEAAVPPASAKKETDLKKEATEAPSEQMETYDYEQADKFYYKITELLSAAKKENIKTDVYFSFANNNYKFSGFKVTGEAIWLQLKNEQTKKTETFDIDTMSGLAILKMVHQKLAQLLPEAEAKLEAQLTGQKIAVKETTAKIPKAQTQETEIETEKREVPAQEDEEEEITAQDLVEEVDMEERKAYWTSYYQDQKNQRALTDLLQLGSDLKGKNFAEVAAVDTPEAARRALTELQELETKVKNIYSQKEKEEDLKNEGRQGVILGKLNDMSQELTETEKRLQKQFAALRVQESEKWKQYYQTQAGQRELTDLLAKDSLLKGKTLDRQGFFELFADLDFSQKEKTDQIVRELNQIRQKIAILYHPDKYQGQENIKNEERFKCINELLDGWLKTFNATLENMQNTKEQEQAAQEQYAARKDKEKKLTTIIDDLQKPQSERNKAKQEFYNMRFNRNAEVFNEPQTLENMLTYPNNVGWSAIEYGIYQKILKHEEITLLNKREILQDMISALVNFSKNGEREMEFWEARLGGIDNSKFIFEQARVDALIAKIEEIKEILENELAG